MPGEQALINNAVGTLTVQAEIAHLTITVDATLAALIAAEISFASQFLLLTLNDPVTPASWEIVKATGIAGQVVTVERAQEGTSAAVWPISTQVSSRVTEGTVERARNQLQRILFDSEGNLLFDASDQILLDEEV